MAFDLARTKLQSRQALHRVLAVSGVYEDSDTPPTGITVRWHNKLARNGALDGGFDVEIIEGIDRLVFAQSELAVALAGAPLTLKSGGTVTIAKYGAVYDLEAQEPDDGPENRYWAVSHRPNE